MQRQYGNRTATLANTEYRAVDGRVTLVDTTTGAFKTISTRDARQRLKDQDEDFKSLIRHFPGSAREIRKFVYDMEQVIREAEEQGPPEDQQSLDDRVRRRPTQILLPKDFKL